MKNETGDNIIYYISKYSKYVAASEVTCSYFFYEEQIWDDPFELWPHRIETKAIVFKEIHDGVFIKDIWDNLEFVKNNIKWWSQV